MPSPTRSILVGGLAGFGFSLMFAWIPGVGPALCCAALFGTGLLAVWHRVAVTGAPVAGGEGVRLGAEAGMVAFVASTLLVFASWLVAGRPNVASQVRAFGDQVRGEMDPQVIDLAAKALDTPLVVLAMVLVWVGLYAVMGLLGGAVGAGVFKKIDRPPGAPQP